MTGLFTIENAIALLTLTGLEIVLGIDNIIFLAILTGKLPERDRPRARITGLGLAMAARIALLICIKWVMGLTQELFSLALPPGASGDAVWFDHGFTGKDLILIAGGLFLIAKSTHEIHSKLESPADDAATGGTAKAANLGAIIVQIIAIDLVFSLDSVITAVGMAKNLLVMITAVVISIGVMMLFAGKIGAFIERHPTIKLLALAFLILIGVMLTAEGFGQHVPKGYVYVAMAFALGVEMLNMRARKKGVATK